MVNNRVGETTSSVEEIDFNAWADSLSNSRLSDKSRVAGIARDAKNLSEGLLESGILDYRHGMMVAELLCTLHADEDTITAAILSPIAATPSQRFLTYSENLSSNLSLLIKGVQDVHAAQLLVNPEHLVNEHVQSDRLRRMLLAMAQDVRVVLIKLADCVVTMRHIAKMEEEKSKTYARAVMDVFAPLASRLGIGQFKWELEDLAFRTLEPDHYKKMARLLDEKREGRESYIENVRAIIKIELEKAEIQAEVHGRAKHLYSIWRKMKKKNRDYSQIYDVRAVRIIVKDVKDCYGVLGVVHSLWRHIPTEFDDYIATPKENGYRSLHTAVIGPERKSLEVQIRTDKMHDESELGVAAHWRYKEVKSGTKEVLDERVTWLRKLLDWQQDVADTSEFISKLKEEALDDRVYVFSPKGDVFELMKGSTVLDFAYHVHSDIGHRCRGAKVNGRIVPLTYMLSTGQSIEVLTGKISEPSRDWLNASLGYIKSHRARSKVHQWFRQQDYEKNLAEGRFQVERELSRLALKEAPLDTIVPKFNLKTVNDLFVGVGRGDIKLMQVVNAVREVLLPGGGDDELLIIQPKKPTTQNVLQDASIWVDGESNVATHIAKCCSPIPGDPVVGFITKNRGITIHRHDCETIFDKRLSDGDRLIEVQWSKKDDKKRFSQNVYILAYDRPGLLRDITRVLASQHINVTGLNTKSNKDENFAEIIITIEISSITELTQILSKIGRVPNIFEVRRQ